MKKIKLILMGLLAGIINGLLGAGGRMVIVQLIKDIVMKKKK